MDEQAMLEETYLDTCIVLRPMPNSDSDGFDTFALTEVYKDIRCAVSFRTQTGISAQDLADVQEVEYSAVLFASPEYRILSGDVVEAKVQGASYKFRAGEGIRYPYHQQIPLLRKDRA